MTTTPIHLITETDFTTWITSAPESVQSQCKLYQFKGKPGTFVIILNAIGEMEKVIAGDNPQDFWCLASLSSSLPPSTYHFVDQDNENLSRLALTWTLHSYQFTRYKKSTKKFATLSLPPEISESVSLTSECINLVRDLVNMPAEDMSPHHLAEAAIQVANQCDAQINVIEGVEALISADFPAIATVGRSADQAPCFIEMNWGKSTDPLFVLVGKGVCFDSGGYDIKPSQAMRLMKKDMGGAATALGLAKLIMLSRLPIQLKLLIPACENAISGRAYRPGDIIQTRKKYSVEIGNTDAEGRLILADALTYAVEAQPKWIIDFATLTGAARVALGTDIPVFFSNHPETLHSLRVLAENENDLIWPLPLYQPYKSLFETSIADLSNSGESPYAGAITAALFLQSFVENTPWIHIDLMAYNLSNRPGRPQGGEAMGLRTLFQWIKTQLN